MTHLKFKVCVWLILKPHPNGSLKSGPAKTVPAWLLHMDSRYDLENRKAFHSVSPAQKVSV